MKNKFVLKLVVFICCFSLTSSASAELLAHWSFDNESDPWHDDSGNGHNGIEYGDPQWGAQQLYFDGIDDFGDVGSWTFGKSETFSIEVAFTSSGVSNNDCLIGYSTGGTPGPGDPGVINVLLKDDGKILAEIMDDNHVFSNVMTELTYNDNNPHTVTFTRNTTDGYIYLTTELEQVSAIDLTTEQIRAPHLSIGCMWDDSIADPYWDGFHGYIDDVKITPEPFTFSLLALGGLVLRRRKRNSQS